MHTAADPRGAGGTRKGDSIMETKKITLAEACTAYARGLLSDLWRPFYEGKETVAKPTDDRCNLYAEDIGGDLYFKGQLVVSKTKTVPGWQSLLLWVQSLLQLVTGQNASAGKIPTFANAQAAANSLGQALYSVLKEPTTSTMSWSGLVHIQVPTGSFETKSQTVLVRVEGNFSFLQ
jgi:hypothetical protein